MNKNDIELFNKAVESLRQYRRYEILDEEELDEALNQGLITKEQKDEALNKLNALLEIIKKGEFPPKECI